MGRLSLLLPICEGILCSLLDYTHTRRGSVLLGFNVFLVRTSGKTNSKLPIIMKRFRNDSVDVEVICK